MTDVVTSTFLEMRDVRKEYPGVVAADDVDLAIEAGTVVGLNTGQHQIVIFLFHQGCQGCCKALAV